MFKFALGLLSWSLISGAQSTIRAFEFTGSAAQDIYESLTKVKEERERSPYLVTQRKTGVISCRKVVIAEAPSYTCQMNAQASIGNHNLKLIESGLLYSDLVQFLTSPTGTDKKHLQCKTRTVTDSIHGDFDGAFSECTLTLKME